MTIKSLKKEAIKSPKIKKAYKKLKAEFLLIDNLLTMRKKAGLTQEDLAQKMSTQRSNICRLEKGSTNPSWKTLQKYAHACGFAILIKFEKLELNG